MDRHDLTAAIKFSARAAGFSLVGVCPALATPGYDRFLAWLGKGFAGTMDYLSRRAAAYANPQHLLAGARSLVMLGMDYFTDVPARSGAGCGRVARYAWGPSDYHDVIRGRLDALIDRLAVLEPSARARGVVDTAPLLERDFARLAGLGWVGKNTLLLNRNAGSWFFLAALIVDIELDHDAPYTADHCGTCRACLEACPTDAFPQPYVLDATRCISYLTIESRELPPAELRKLTGDWVFGCDVCQDVCPWNRRREGRDAPDFRPDDSLNPFDLMSLFFQDDEQFRKRFRPTPLWRPKRRGMLRNAAIVLGNQRHPAAIPALAHGLRDPEPLVRATCAWALGQFALPDAQLALEQARTGESDGRVLAEIQISLHSVDHAKDPFAAIHRSTDSDRT